MDDAVIDALHEVAPLGKPRADVILCGGSVVGILDMLFAFTFYGLFLGVPYLRIFQTVAGGVLGRPALMKVASKPSPSVSFFISLLPLASQLFTSLRVALCFC